MPELPVKVPKELILGLLLLPLAIFFLLTVFDWACPVDPDGKRCCLCPQSATTLCDVSKIKGEIISFDVVGSKYSCFGEGDDPNQVCLILENVNLRVDPIPPECGYIDGILKLYDQDDPNNQNAYTVCHNEAPATEIESPCTDLKIRAPRKEFWLFEGGGFCLSKNNDWLQTYGININFNKNGCIETIKSESKLKVELSIVRSFEGGSETKVLDTCEIDNFISGPTSIATGQCCYSVNNCPGTRDEGWVCESDPAYPECSPLLGYQGVCKYVGVLPPLPKTPNGCCYNYPNRNSKECGEQIGGTWECEFNSLNPTCAGQLGGLGTCKFVPGEYRC